jgi:DNA-binding transcriptional ArsR family regulator
VSLSPVKRLVLETIWMLNKPVKPVEVAEEVGLSFPTVMMHVVGLTRMGYVKAVEKGYYTITDKGREALGLPMINGEKARQILSYVPAEKAFYFYTDIGKPLGIFASSLSDFCEKIQKIDNVSIEFHLYRGDFEAWFNGIGDVELARKTALLRERKLSGEELRKKLYEIVKNRCEELAKLKRQPTATLR